jgi:hypothetical protein
MGFDMCWDQGVQWVSKVTGAAFRSCRCLEAVAADVRWSISTWGFST